MTQQEDALIDVAMTASQVFAGTIARSLEAAPGDLGMAGLRTLVLLTTRGPQPISAVADLLGVHHSNASRLTARLDRQGLTERSRSASDARSVEVAATARGHQVVADVMGVRRLAVAEVLERLSPEDAAALTAALTAFVAAAGEPHWRETGLADWAGLARERTD